ncbi:ATP-binding cassette, subfamily B [Eubacterium uniforme]|uniref:ATP-binding cassette, subfamily B n=1 Tax=Eubacterium uniforme TaxID=39495 RepID=A0A1T4V494_9FIRM|nr:ABC transporter ATP-binding protein [Eubacterium uniforme]SKA59712.1 ATP-binding cassette, subfamily B [Eubacterium uniforme]
MKENLKKMASFYKPYMGTFMLDMFFAFVASGIALVIPLTVRSITSDLSKGNKSMNAEKIYMIGAILVVLVFIQLFANYYISNFGHVMGAKIEYDMRAEIFNHYQKLSFSFYDDQKIGQLMSRITNDLFDITELLHHGPENIAISFIKIIGAFIILTSISLKLTIAAFVLVPIMFIYAFILNKKMKRAFKKNRVEIAEVNARIEDNLSGIRVVKSYANEDIENEKFKIGNDGFLRAKKESYKYMGLYHSGLTAFTMLINICVIVVGGVLMSNHKLAVADFVAFLLYINVFTDPIKTLIDFTEQFQNGYSGFERFMEILNIEPDIQDKEGAVELENVKGDIEFNDVSFKYNDNAHRVLRHIDLKIPQGQYLAIVGSSGGGKTTLCSLIPRFYEVTKGNIKIDGKDVRDVTLQSLRDNIGLVQQDVYLFSGTIFDNIKYGKPDATYEEVVEAAKNANAHDFIMSLPDGYNTDIGQRGVKLSGGQKQRLSIARVFLKNPPILIFDEATSALDNESESIVKESLEKLAKNRTTLVIAHRLSTIKNADKIIVLTENGIEETGTHEELLAKNGIYKELYSYT